MTEHSSRKLTERAPATARPTRKRATDRDAIEAAYARVDALDSERARNTEFPPQFRAKLAIRDEKPS